MKNVLTIFGFSLGPGSSLVFCETSEQAVVKARAYRSEIKTDGQIESLPPTPIYRIVLRPLTTVLLMSVLNAPDLALARILEMMETIEFVEYP
jgi:hypothetical protein